MLSESLGNQALCRVFTHHANESWTICVLSFPTYLNPHLWSSSPSLLPPSFSSTYIPPLPLSPKQYLDSGPFIIPQRELQSKWRLLNTIYYSFISNQRLVAHPLFPNQIVSSPKWPSFSKNRPIFFILVAPEINIKICHQSMK